MTEEDKRYIADMRKATALQQSLFPELNPCLYPSSEQKEEPKEKVACNRPSSANRLQYSRTRLLEFREQCKDAPADLSSYYMEANPQNVNDIFLHLEQLRTGRR